jgi:1,4-alpha-glucan branching enzyme
LNDYLSLIVTAHVPYLRHHGRDPVDEDALHIVVAEALVPLCNLLLDMHDDGVVAPLGLACSPVLLEQLADPVVQKHFVLWMERWLAGVEAELTRWHQEQQQHLIYLAQFYLEWGETILTSYKVRLHRNLVSTLRQLCEVGMVEPLLIPATDALLDLNADTLKARAQIEIALLNTAHHLGQRPRGMLLRHGYQQGLDVLLRDVGVSYIVAPAQNLPTSASGWLLGRRLAGLVRHNDLEMHVASPELGYVGDPLYRAAASRAAPIAPVYQRIGMGVGATSWYDPYHAFQRADEHAAHFMRAVQQHPAESDESRLSVVMYDIGYGRPYWFEYVTWLRKVIELAAAQARLVAPSDYLRRYPPRRLLEATSIFDLSREAADPPLVHALRRLSAQVSRLPRASVVQERLLNQAVRELLLAQDGAWAGVGEDDAVAKRRKTHHLATLNWLLDRVAAPQVDQADLIELELIEDRDSVFQLLNYRIFANE